MVVAAPVIVNKEPLQGREDRCRPILVRAMGDVESIPAEGTVLCRVKKRIGAATQSASYERTTSGTVAMRE